MLGNRGRVLVAMSGGVDSSVAAWMLREQGYDCIGVTMKLFGNQDIGLDKGHPCCTLDDVADAKDVCRRLGIPHYVFNFMDDFEEKVIHKFIQSYQRGETPNPCIDCNRYLKFERLMHRASELKCDYMATGHYARIVRAGERFVMKKGVDGTRDQSYALYAMTQDQLAHTLFPLGGLHKAEVRRIAQEQGFVNAKKHDSQDICFVPDGDYLSFIERHTGQPSQPGDLIDREGNVLGTHRGAAGYTIGQRRGLGVPAGERIYVCGKCMEDNTVTLGPESALYSSGCLAEDWNWMAERPSYPFEAKVKVRYRMEEQPVTVTAEEGRIRLAFHERQRAVTPGQAAVLYQDCVVLGGGTVTEVL